MEKNNTYDIWGNGISNTYSTTNSASSQKTTSYLDYNGTTSVEPDSGYLNRVVSNSDSLSVFAYDISTNVRQDVDEVVSKIDKLEEKIKIQEVKAKEDIDYIQDKLDNLTKKVDQIQQVSEVLGDRISELDERQEKRNKCSVRKDNEKIMNTNKMFNFDFGFVDSNIRMSPYGMAVRNADGRYVSYDVKTGSVIDVEPFNFEGHRLMMKMPVAIKDVAIGDIVIHNHKPMFVVSTGDKITAIDIYNGEEKTILPTFNMFNFNYITKVFSLFNFTGNNTPTAENPFGNIIPFMLMGNENMDMKDFFTMMAIANGGNMSSMFQNPIMMYMMFNGTTEMKEMLPFMMMSGAFNQTPVNNNHNCNCNNNGQN